MCDDKRKQEIEAELLEIEKSESGLRELLKKLDDDTQDISAEYKENLRDIDGISDSWRGAAAERFQTEASENLSDLHSKMQHTLGEQRDGIIAAIERLRDKSRELQREKKEDY